MYISIGGDMAVRDGSIIGIFDLDGCSMSKKTMEYLQNAESHAEFPFRWVWEFYPTAFDSDAAELTERERQFVSELKELDADDRTICSMTLEFLGLEGQFLITQRGNAYFEWMGYDGLFEKLQKMESKNSNLIGLNEII